MSTTTNQSSPNKNSIAIKSASFIAMLGFILICAWSSHNDISQKTFIPSLYLSIFLELVSIGAMLELMFTPALEFASFRWSFAAVLAVVAFFARAQAMTDVNSIFHIDPGALPMTLIAGTAMRFATYLFWPMAVVACISALALIVMKYGTVLDGADEVSKISAWSRGIFALIASLLALGIIHFQLSEQGIKTKLYRLSHDTDFVAKFDCKGFKTEKVDALFIGPDQRKALFAPKIQEEFWLNSNSNPPEIMKPVKIPTVFAIADCVPEQTTAPDIEP